MRHRLAVIMDPLTGLKPEKDTTLALMEAAESRGFEVACATLRDLAMVDGRARVSARSVHINTQNRPWFEFTGPAVDSPLGEFDCILMRKDPPFDLEYIVATYILEHAQAEGALVVNDPQSLRDTNEKFFTTWFAEFAPPTLISRDPDRIRAFHAAHPDLILKPLDAMGGASVFHVGPEGRNLGVIIETLTAHGTRFCVAQRFIPEIVEGDRRVLVVDGEPIRHVLARIPQGSELRGNLAAGGRGEVQPISTRECEIAEALGPVLVEMGHLFVGLDVIGGWLTEINVTSPTCVREIEAGSDCRIAERFIDAVMRRLDSRG